MTMTGFSHIVINVRDIARSVAFYEATTPLRQVGRADAPQQAFATLGIAQGAFAGALLRDPSTSFSPTIHLVQWLNPGPVGQAYGGFTNPGFFRICFKQPDAAAAYDQAVRSGAEPFGPPLMPEGQNITGRPVFSTPDPDGIVLQHVTLPGPGRLLHTCLNCTDLASSAAFFDALGLRRDIESATSVPVKNAFGPPGLPATYEAILFDHPADRRVDGYASYNLDLARWKTPAPAGEVYASQLNIGIVRLGLVSPNLAASGLETSAVETRDFGPMGTRRAVVLRSPDGALVELFDRPLVA